MNHVTDTHIHTNIYDNHPGTQYIVYKYVFVSAQHYHHHRVTEFGT